MMLYESPSTEFLEATAEWERAYGKVRPAYKQTLCVTASVLLRY
jgi:hypothetical protein